MNNSQQKHAKVFYVPFTHRGFTENLLKTSLLKIKGHDYSKILYLAPTPKKIKDAQHVIHRLTKGFYVPPAMMTIKQFSKRLYSSYGDKSLISKALISILISRFSGKGIGFSSIIGDFIDEIKQYRPHNDIDSIHNELKDIFKELNVPEEGSQRAMDAIEIFRTYQEILNRHKVLDENDVLRECPELIEQHRYNADTLILDSFYEITPAEELILKKLIEHSKTALISMPYDKNFNEITNCFVNFLKNNFIIEDASIASEKLTKEPYYISYPAIDEEVEGIARHIKNLFISGKYRTLDDIILTFPKLSIYSEITQRVFRRYGIPITSSISKPLGKTRPFLDLITMLESISDDYPRLQFSQFLISPHFKKMPEIFRQYIPKIALNSGIIRGKNSWLNLKKSEADRDDELSEINKQLRWIFKKLAPLESIKDTGTFRQISEILQKLIIELDFSDIEIDAKEQTMQALKELSLIDYLSIIPATPLTLPLVMGGTGGIRDGLGNLPCGLRQFIDSLKYILNTMETEMEGTGVQVISFFELRGVEPEYLYFGGLKDGDLPSMPEIDHILPDNVRTRLGLVNMKRYLHLQKFIFERLIDSSKNIHLSYPAIEADKLFLPSPFLPWKAETIEQIPGILCKEEELLRYGEKPFSSHIKEIGNIKRHAFGERAHINVTYIDNYRICPRKFFIEKVLNLEPAETKEYEIEAALLGSIVHEIMEKLIAKPFTNLEEMKVTAEKLLKELLSEQEIENYWKDFIKDSFLSILPDIYEIESGLKADEYSFMKAEVPVEGEVLKGIRLKGKIDRVDSKVQSANEIQLIDYKTGAAQFSGSEVLNKGANLQLFLYAALMKSLGFKVDRVGIYSLKDIKITWLPNRSDRRDGRTIEDYVIKTLKYLEETLSKMREGDFTASPLNEVTCRNCHERPYCPYIQMGS